MTKTITLGSRCRLVGCLLAVSLCLISIAWQPVRASFVARRAADDSRPLNRVNQANQEAPVVLGRFRAPAPEQITRHRLAKSHDIGSQPMSVSFRVADQEDGHLGSSSERTIHGVQGASVNNNNNHKLVKVGAKMQVSDEGLNYPPSKLSADIYGNVAEIVTAPPESVENDFLIPQSNSFFGDRFN